MASTDNEIIQPLQRPSSSDINTLQSLLGAATTSGAQNFVLGGLCLSPNGANSVGVSAGAMFQFSTTLAPALGTYDSPYRLGINHVPGAVTMGVPVSESWTLIEAQMSDTVTVTSNIDILDPTTGVFAPQLLPKVDQRLLTFQYTTQAGSIPAFSGGNWVPIGAVHQPAGGGVVTAADIIDLRALWSGRLAHNNEQAAPGFFEQGCRRGSNGKFVYSSPACLLDAEVFTAYGERLWFSGTPDLTSATIRESGFSTAANTWYYLYLAPFRPSSGQPRSPVNGQGSANTGRGLLVLSAVAPNYLGYNTGNITPGAPFNTSAILSAGDAICVGALYRNAGNTDYLGVYSSDGREFQLTDAGGLTAYPNVSTVAPFIVGQNPITSAAGTVPQCADEVILQTLFYGATAGAGNDRSFYVTPSNVDSTQISNIVTARESGIANPYYSQLTYSRRVAGSDNFNIISAGAADVVSDLNIYVKGWRM